MELNVLSQELDRLVLGRLAARRRQFTRRRILQGVSPRGEPAGAAAPDRADRRGRQGARRLRAASRWCAGALAMMRRPARLAGSRSAARLPRSRLQRVSVAWAAPTSSSRRSRRARRRSSRRSPTAHDPPIREPLEPTAMRRVGIARIRRRALHRRLRRERVGLGHRAAACASRLRRISVVSSRRHALSSSCRARMDLALDRGLERRQQEAELHVERDRVLADVHAAGYARPLEVDVVALPRVVEREALLQVLRDLLGDVLRLLVRQRVLLGDRDHGHRGSSRSSGDDAV